MSSLQLTTPYKVVVCGQVELRERVAEGKQCWSSECGGHTFTLVLQVSLASASYPKAFELPQPCHCPWA